MIFIQFKNNEKVEIGFRLGGISNTAEGTAWFSDFTIEEGSTDESNIWNFGVFLIDNVNATIEGKKQNYSMTTMEKNIVENNMQRLQNSIADMSKQSNEYYI